MDPQDRPIAPEAAPAARRRTLRHRNLLKLGGIATLALLLLVPLALLVPVVADRMARRGEAVRDIQKGWGDEQMVVGPVLVVPYRDPAAPDAVHFAYAFPQELKVDGELVPEERWRGIYRAVVYSASLTVSGTFRRPADLGVPDDQLQWSQAFVALGVPDLRGVGDALVLDWGKDKVPFLPGTRLPGMASGIHAAVPIPPAGEIAFSVALDLRGSGGIRFAPLGVESRVELRSHWPHPRFEGPFLPATRSVTSGGFTASWRVSQYGRNLDQAGKDPLPSQAIGASAFGVDLLLGIDGYRSVERAIKYGVLFIALTFASFFIFETRARVRIHPFQYGMVGLGIAVFFLLLLALSEVVPFVAAYGGAAAATIGLIALYMASVLRSRRRALAVAGALGASFALLYVVLQAEDYALLAGSVAIFAVLAVAMKLTHQTDWYAEDAEA